MQWYPAYIKRIGDFYALFCFQVSVIKIRAKLGSYLIDKGSFFLVPGLPLLLMINLLWVGAGLLISNLQAETLMIAGFDVGITDMFLGIATILLGLIGVLLQVKRLKAIWNLKAWNSGYFPLLHAFLPKK